MAPTHVIPIDRAFVLFNQDADIPGRPRFKFYYAASQIRCWSCGTTFCYLDSDKTVPWQHPQPEVEHAVCPGCGSPTAIDKEKLSDSELEWLARANTAIARKMMSEHIREAAVKVEVPENIKTFIANAMYDIDRQEVGYQ